MVAQWVKRPIAYSAGIRFSGEFTSVLAVKIWVEFDLSGSLCHSGGSYRPLAVLRLTDLNGSCPEVGAKLVAWIACRCESTSPGVVRAL